VEEEPENLSSVHTTNNGCLIFEVEFSCINLDLGKILAAGALSNILLISAAIIKYLNCSMKASIWGS